MAHTAEQARRITVTLPEGLLEEAESWLEAHERGNRSRLIQDALKLYLKHLKTRRLEAEAAKLSDAEEESLAEEGFEAVNETWPDY